jgi:aminoglycoside/choline kinase family phosphotransferase
VNLNDDTQNAIEQYYGEKLSSLCPQWIGKWQKGYILCRLTRNLQILGAFGFLSKVKKKPFFAQFIPPAIASLKNTLRTNPMDELSKLTDLVNQIPPYPKEPDL